MISDPINIITYPDYDHNSDLKIVLVADTPLIPLILELIETQDTRISIHCITSDEVNFEWIANTVNQASFVFVSGCSKLDKLLKGWILGRPNVWHNLDTAKSLNAKYTTDVMSALVNFLGG
jgi:hypothetical protein